MANRNVARAVRVALITASAASAAMYGSTSAAQEQLGEIVVTGSRIVRPDFEAASPVVSLTAETFKQSGVVNAEQLVNTLPQVVPSFSSGNNNPGGGQSYINLRGLGSVRNLVLMDGKRLVPGNESALVDINTIPTSMIERIDVVSGGASAVYGSDAIAGATNFIMKKNFTGIEVSGQYGISEEGDADTGAISVTMGADLADGRGNVVAFASFNDRQALSKGDRKFSAQAVSGTSFFPSGHLRRASGNAWTVDAQNDVFTNLYGTTAPSGLSNMGFNDDGTLFAGTGLNNFKSVDGEGQDGLYFAQNFPNGANNYSYNFEPWNNLIIPQQRISAGVFGDFDVTDRVEAYTRILLTNYSSSTQLAPSPAPTGANNSVGGVPGEFTIPVTNPFVQANAGVLALANSRTGDNVGLQGSGPTEDLLYRYRFVSNGPRKETYERDVYQILLGTRGEITDNWSFDVYAGHGKFNEQLDQAGNVSVPKVEELLDAADGGVSLCEGGFNPFGFGGLSPACADYVGVTAKNTAQIEHNMAEGTLSGDLFSLPAGAVSTTVGAFWQEMTYRSLKDEILRSGDVSGFNAEDNISGRVANTDLFVEFYVPLLSDITAVENLALTAGYRYSDNTPSGTNSSYKAELDWTISDSFRVRGGYQRAVRAPNIAELYSPQNEDNPEVDDPCNYDSVERLGSNVAQVEALCVAQGIPAAVLGTAGDPNSYKQSNSQIDALAGGNPDLQEETADTYTIGVVWTPDFADRLSVSLDYYDIEVSDAISAIDPSTVVARCFNADGANPNYEVDNFYCNLFDRFVATSEIKDLEETQNNIGGIRTSGVDLQVDWGFDIGSFGDIGLNFVSTYVNNFERQELPGDIWLDFVGTIGDNVGETLPDWKATLTGVWNIAGFSTMLRMRYLPSMELEDSVISGSTDPGVDSIMYIDLSTRWQVTDALSLRLGVENLTNEDPQLFSPDVDSGTDPSTYDVIGRRYFMTATYKF
jgi:iron complex outermembrane receptor protein